MKYDYINIVNFRLHDDYTGIRWSECGDNNIFIDGNGNGPYDFRFSKVRKYYFYGELPEKYILNITTGDFRNAPENGIFKTIKSNHRILKDLKDGNAKILINRIGEFDTFINGKLSDSEYTTLIHNLFKSGVNKSNILYLNFNSIVEEAMCNSDIKSRYHNFTMLNLYSIIKDKEGKYREIFEKQKNSLREYYYLCYNNSSKPHRRKIVSYLLEKKFKGLLSSTEYNIFLDDAIPYAGNPERDSGWSGRNGNLYY